MIELCRLIWCGLVGLFRSRVSLEIEILALRHQINVLRRKAPKRAIFTNIDLLCVAAPGTRPDPAYKPRSVVPGPALPLVSHNAAGSCHRSARDGDRLASARLSLLLALEVTFAGRVAKPSRLIYAR